MEKVNLVEININPADIVDVDIVLNDKLFEGMGITLEQVRNKITDKDLDSLNEFMNGLFNAIRESLKETE